MAENDLHICTVCGAVDTDGETDECIVTEPGVEIEGDWYVHVHEVDMDDDIDDAETEEEFMESFTITELYVFCPECAPEETFPTADEAPEDFDIKAEIEALD